MDASKNEPMQPRDLIQERPAVHARNPAPAPDAAPVPPMKTQFPIQKCPAGSAGAEIGEWTAPAPCTVTTIAVVPAETVQAASAATIIKFVLRRKGETDGGTEVAGVDHAAGVRYKQGNPEHCAMAKAFTMAAGDSLVAVSVGVNLGSYVAHVTAQG